MTTPRINFKEIKDWTIDNFFGSKLGILLTLFSALVITYFVLSMISFLSSAEWEVVTTNRRLLLLGRLPEEDTWRAWPILWLFCSIFCSSIGAWGNPKKRELLLLLLAFLMPAAIFFTLPYIVHIFATVLIGSVAYISSKIIRRTSYIEILKKALVSLWILIIPLSFTILIVGGGPQSNLWGGFLLNILLASVAVVAGFPLGILMAVGRATKLPVIKTVCTVYIETVRGAPLVGWLLLAWFVLPKFLPDLFGLNDLSVVIRAMIVLSFFASAYIAEVIRGGLQSISKGQLEAADALNLGYIDRMRIIVLPQAIRVVIPAIVSQFIGLFKDTSLVFILALTDLLQVGRIIPEQDPKFFGKQLEALLVVASLFWVVSVVLSNLSSKIEKNLGIGTR
ncbi:MAG: amino acid ABC transporter permease [SAR202 cluster bacterium]|nr:amino acid ABC transporter permease [SAR202 cluster bacterium]|tara:strand:- start:2293 stop:3474 length:1182 start_codon:yes stop_codon:yes gene_type:complete